MKRFLLFLIALFVALAAFAQTAVEMRPRVVTSDSATRRTDLNFQMAATTGFSVTQVSGSYNLFGPYLANEQAWNSAGTDMVGLTYPDPKNPDWFSCYGNQRPCDPLTLPEQRDPRCGDSAGVVWKTPLSSVNSWLFLHQTTGASIRVLPNPSTLVESSGGWPRQWPHDCPMTGADGWAPVVSAAKINAAIPSPPPLLTSHNCTRDFTSPRSLATGAADAKAVYVNGKWYMAFDETVNNPNVTYDSGGHPVSASWSSGDVFVAMWAVSDDGKNWTIRRQLFHTTYEATECNPGLVVTQLTTDGNYFYLMADEYGHAGLLLFRAAIDQSQTDGFTQWQIATHDPNNPNRYLWVNTPANGYIDSTALNAYSIMPGSGFVRQGAMVRVFSSSAAGSPSRIIGITNHSPDLTTGTLDVWSAPDLDTPFSLESYFDTASIKAVGSNG